jgi:hypothetical protein
MNQSFTCHHVAIDKATVVDGTVGEDHFAKTLKRVVY